MEEHNSVQLIGNVAQEVEVRRTTPSGNEVANLRLGVSGRRESSFFTVVAWGELANQAAVLSKGTRVLVRGRLQSRSWDGPDGSKRSAVEVVASELVPQAAPVPAGQTTTSDQP